MCGYGRRCIARAGGDAVSGRESSGAAHVLVTQASSGIGEAACGKPRGGRRAVEHASRATANAVRPLAASSPRGAGRRRASPLRDRGLRRCGVRGIVRREVLPCRVSRRGALTAEQSDSRRESSPRRYGGCWPSSSPASAGSDCAGDAPSESCGLTPGMLTAALDAATPSSTAATSTARASTCTRKRAQVVPARLFAGRGSDCGWAFTRCTRVGWTRRGWRDRCRASTARCAPISRDPSRAPTRPFGPPPADAAARSRQLWARPSPRGAHRVPGTARPRPTAVCGRARPPGADGEPADAPLDGHGQSPGLARRSSPRSSDFANAVEVGTRAWSRRRGWTRAGRALAAIPDRGSSSGGRRCTSTRRSSPRRRAGGPAGRLPVRRLLETITFSETCYGTDVTYDAKLALRASSGSSSPHAGGLRATG